MIADFVNFVIAGKEFCHAAGGLILRRAISGGVNTVMTQSWGRRPPEHCKLKNSASAENCL
jgi:hypothetical protein